MNASRASKDALWEACFAAVLSRPRADAFKARASGLSFAIATRDLLTSLLDRALVVTLPPNLVAAILVASLRPPLAKSWPVTTSTSIGAICSNISCPSPCSYPNRRAVERSLALLSFIISFCSRAQSDPANAAIPSPS